MSQDMDLLLQALRGQFVEQQQGAGIAGFGNINPQPPGGIQLLPSQLQGLQSGQGIPMPAGQLPDSALLGLDSALNPMLQEQPQQLPPRPGLSAFFQPENMAALLGPGPPEPAESNMFTLDRDNEIMSLLDALGGPQGLGAEAQQGAEALGPQAPAVPQIGAPGMAPLETGTPADFSGARAALGPEVSAQTVGAPESLSRVLGGGAAGGLQAIQGAKPGTAASLGEVIAGIGAGTSVARAVVGQENRRLKEIATRNESLRKRQLSSVELAEEASNAELSAATAESFNTRELAKSEMAFRASIANAQLLRPIPTGNGQLFLPGSGEFIGEPHQTMEELLQTFELISEIYKGTTERTGTVLGQSIVRENISPIMQGPVYLGMQALALPPVFDAFVATLEANGNEDLASNVVAVNKGTIGGNSDHAKAIAALAGEQVSFMILENINSPDDPPHPWLLEVMGPEFQLPGIQTSQDFDNILQSLGVQ